MAAWSDDGRFEGNVVVVTGASSGFGALTSDPLARAGHTVYEGIRDI